MIERTDITERLLLAALIVLLVLITLSLSGCQTMETTTTTTTTSPDGVQTTVTKRPVVDPMDAAMAEAAGQLMQGGFAP